MNQVDTFEARKQSLRSESYGQSLGEYWKFWSQTAEHSSGCPQKRHSPRLDFMIYDREYQAKHIISEQSLVSKTPHFSSNVAGKATYETTFAQSLTGFSPRSKRHPEHTYPPRQSQYRCPASACRKQPRHRDVFTDLLGGPAVVAFYLGEHHS